MILRYIYGGRLSLEEYDTTDIIKILVASSELDFQELIIHLQSFLIENKESWMEQNCSLIYKTSFENDSFSKLQHFCRELISKEPEKIFNSNDFNSISEECLISLIQHDNIQMDVIQIWEHILKWGIAQNPELPSDPSNYSKDDFITLKNTLQRLISSIKFNNLNSEEFLDNVYPYKKLIPKELREDLIKHFLNPKNQSIENLNNSKSIDSRIITIQHTELISKWIDRLEITDEMKSSYEFNLILRGSHDGRISEDLEDCAIFNCMNYGPSFGAGCDLKLCGDNCYDKSAYYHTRCYNKPIRESNCQFFVEEYEVFQIMKID
ncbi:BTB/POZ protein [Rhizophagus irregularis DAOM 181602=DAOM 197198]|nr:BTB/POZ protein [Rhizophagus irregularis DAOM 181602=DAOM 197198]